MARVKRIYGDTLAMTTTAAHKAIPRGYTEIKHQAGSPYRLGLAPSLERVFYFNGTTYTDYTTQARDRDSATHVPLDGMTTAHYLYMGFSECPRGAYFDIGSNVQDEAATLDIEYGYDTSDGTYIKITGTVSGAFTVGETVTGGTSGATATLVYGPAGSTYIIVKSPSTSFLTSDTITGASENISAITAIAAETKGTGYFADVTGDSDGTDSGGDTLKVDGLYSWTLPTSIEATVNGASSLHWVRFKPSATLSATVDINEIIPACIDTNYGYFEAGVEYHYPLDIQRVGAIETDMDVGFDTLIITWVKT